MLSIWKEYLSRLVNLERRLKALETTNQIQVIGLSNNLNSYVGTVFGINTLTYTDFANSDFTFTLPRSTLVLLLATCNYYHSRSSGSGGWTAHSQIQIDVDGDEEGLPIDSEAEDTGSGDTVGAVHMTTSTMHVLKAFAAGAHTAKLKAKLISTTNNGVLSVYHWQFSYVVFGQQQ